MQDHHTLAGGWGPWVTPFVVSGHEVIGKVVEVGKSISEFKVGDRVGVGAQVGACGECKACKKDLGTSAQESGARCNRMWTFVMADLGAENYCAAKVDGYNTLCKSTATSSKARDADRS